MTLVEYGDYQCPHCQAAWPQVELVLREISGMPIATSLSRLCIPG